MELIQKKRKIKAKEAIIKDCMQDLDVDFQGLAQGLMGKNCEIKAIEMEEGISEDLKDPYSELTDNMKKYTYNKFKCLFECYKDEQNTCQKNAC